MPLKNVILKTAILGIVSPVLLSTVVPEIAQAQKDYPGVIIPTDRYRAKYITRTAVPDTNPNPNIGLFIEGIKDFSVLDNFVPNTVIGSKRGFLNLVTQKIADNFNQLPNDLKNSFPNYSNISGPIYEYSFFVTQYPNIPLDPANKPFPYDNAGFTKWYIPSNFTYTASGKSFNINFGTGNSGDLTKNLLNSLGGLETILKAGNAATIPSLFFPSNILAPDGQTRINVEIETTPIPEPSQSTSLIGLGILGSFIFLKRKLVRNDCS